MEDEEGRLLSEDEIGALLSSLDEDDSDPAEDSDPIDDSDPAEDSDPIDDSDLAEDSNTADGPSAATDSNSLDDEVSPGVDREAELRSPELPPLPEGLHHYDFRQPERISKEQLTSLGSLHEQFASALSATLGGLLRTRVEFEVKSSEQTSYGAYVDEATEGHLYHVLALSPLPGVVALEVSGSAAFAMLERMLGGSGRSTVLRRPMTDIEAGVFNSKLTPYFLAALSEAWVDTQAIEPSLAGEVFTSASLLQIALASDAVAVITVSGHVADVEAMVTLCLPHGTLEPVLPNLGAELLVRRPRETSPDETKRVRDRLVTIKLPISAELGGTDVTVDELLGLQVGDVVRLDSVSDREITVLVNGLRKYKARPGLVGSRVAMRVAELVTDETEEGMTSDGTG